MQPYRTKSDGSIDYDACKAEASRLRTAARRRAMRWIARSAVALVVTPWRAVRAAFRNRQHTWPSVDPDRSKPPRVSVYADPRK